MVASGDLYELLRKGQSNSIISNVIVPFPCADSEIPVAFLSGSVNLKKSLRKDGRPVDLDDEVKRLEELQSKLGEVIDLTQAASELKIDTEGIEEKEIKENWSEKDEELFKNRGLRVAKASRPLSATVPSRESSKPLPSDIEVLLRAAEEEETEDEPVISKIAELKKEVALESKSTLPKLPKMTTITSSPVLGDIVERRSESLADVNSAIAEDEVSKRVLMNEVKAAADKKVSKFKQSTRQ